MTTVETRSHAAVSLWVPGEPAPQGSKKGIPRTNKRTGKLSVALIESSKRCKPWRDDIRDKLLSDEYNEHREHWPYNTGGISVILEFVMPRPAATPKSYTPDAEKRPDIDKLTRAVLDGVGFAGVWRDDSQVTTKFAHKRLAEPGETSGCQIDIYPHARAFVPVLTDPS